MEIYLLTYSIFGYCRIETLFKNPDKGKTHKYYRSLYPTITADIEVGKGMLAWVGSADHWVLSTREPARAGIEGMLYLLSIICE